MHEQEHMEQMNEESEMNENTSADAESCANDAQTQELEQQLDECRVQLNSAVEQYRRANADMVNYEKRVARERERWAREARAAVFREVLSVIDGFDRALEQVNSSEKQNDDALKKGVEMIYAQLKQACKKFVVTEMDNYDRFDPEYHEAIAHVDAPEVASGVIVMVAEKGYLIDGVVLRHAQVTIAT